MHSYLGKYLGTHSARMCNGVTKEAIVGYPGVISRIAQQADAMISKEASRGMLITYRVILPSISSRRPCQVKFTHRGEWLPKVSLRNVRHNSEADFPSLCILADQFLPPTNETTMDSTPKLAPHFRSKFHPNN